MSSAIQTKKNVYPLSIKKEKSPRKRKNINLTCSPSKSFQTKETLSPITRKDQIYTLKKLEYSTNENSEKTNINKRFDRKGIEINSKNKKNIKVSFIDEYSNNPFAQVVDIESYKQLYQQLYTPTLKDTKNESTNCCKGCIII